MVPPWPRMRAMGASHFLMEAYTERSKLIHHEVHRGAWVLSRTMDF